MKTTIRQEKVSDLEGIRNVNNLAFGQPNEGQLVDNLRGNTEFIKQLSLVAESEGKVIGHILFFPIWIDNGHSKHQSLALAPMSVLPSHQNQGIGGRLIAQGLKEAKTRGFKSVIVLGHEAYYPKFGFLPASQWGIKAPFDVPDNAFMAQELSINGLKGMAGTVEYPKEFDEV